MTARRHHSTPAPDPAVAVFYAPARKDYLVGYESTDGFLFHRRNFYLGENVERLMDQKKPRFTSTFLKDLEPVPVNQGTNVLPAAFANQRVTIQTELGQIGPYPLPTYEDGRGTAIQVVLTPFTVAGDLALFSLAIAVVGALHGQFVPCTQCSH